MYNPFGMNSARQGFGQQGSNQPYNFKGLEDRLGKLETGIAGLTDQFKNFKMPGQETVDPVYTGNTAPNPLTPEAPTGGIQSLPTPQNAGFTFDPEGGSLMSQLSSAYGGQTNEEWGGGMGQPGFTQGFADFFTGEGYYADPRGTWVDGPWNISDKPIDVGPRFGGTLDPYGNPGGGPSLWPQQPQPQPSNTPTVHQQLNFPMMPGNNAPSYQIPLSPSYQQQMSSLQGPTQQSIGSGINGLASLVSQQGYQV